MPTIDDYYRNKYQYALEDYNTSTPEGDQQAVSYAPGYAIDLLNLRQKVMSGTATAWDRQNYQMQVEAARSVPMRDTAGLSYNAGEDGTGAYVSGGSPDLAHLMLTLAEKLERGQANTHERDLFTTTYKMLADQNYRASVPQESDANPFGMGDNLMGALMMLSIGAGGAAAAAPLAAGAGLTMGSAGGLLGAASGVTSLLAAPLDAQALKLAGMAMGAAGGVTSLASLLSNGLNSVGDVVKAVQKVYGTGTKAMNLIKAAQAGAADPRTLAQAQAADNRTQGRTVGSNTQASTAQGGGMDFSQLGPILAGVVGMVGQGLSLQDASRYMEQLKANFGDQQEIKDMIDQAYKLAVTRYETTYARSEEEYKQKQEQYTQQKERYETHYQDTRREQEQKQAAYAKGEWQTDEDRATQYEHYRDQRAKYDQSYQQRVQEAAQDRDRKITVFGEDRGMAMADYNRRVQEAAQDRQKEYATFDQQMARHMGREDKREAEVAQDRAKQYGVWDEQYGTYKDDYGRRVAETAEDRALQKSIFGDQYQRYQTDYGRRVAETAEDRALQKSIFGDQYQRYQTDYDRRVAETAQERGMDMAGYQARHAIGAGLRDPAQLAAGAQAVYNPLSAAARDRISVQAEEEMARRGVAGGGQYSNLMAAKAFAPQEAQLWQNAMQNYMAGQTGALTAYGNVDLASSPEYRFQQVPQFSTSPEYRMQQMPEFSTSPEYRMQQMPEFARTQAYNWAQTPNFTNSPEYRQMTVPEMGGTPQYTGTNVPTFSRVSANNVPGAVGRPESPRIPSWTPPGSAPNVPGRDSLPIPYQAYDGGKNSTMTKIVGELTKALGSGGAAQAAIPAIMKLLGLGGDGSNAAVQRELNDLMRNNDLYGFQPAPSYDPFSFDPGQQTDFSDIDPWYNVAYAPEVPGMDF